MSGTATMEISSTSSIDRIPHFWSLAGSPAKSIISKAAIPSRPPHKSSTPPLSCGAFRSGKWKKPIVTEIVDAGTFTRAEEYHQKYLEKNPGGYTCHFMRD